MRLYTAIIQTGNRTTQTEGFIKWRNISNRTRLIDSVKRIYPQATFINLYDKATKDLIETIKL